MHKYTFRDAARRIEDIVPTYDKPTDVIYTRFYSRVAGNFEPQR